MKPYCFIGTFKLVVYARSLMAARRYVKSQWASRAHRSLKYVGQREPVNPEGWVAAQAED